MEKEELIRQLKAAQQQLQPGNPEIYNFAHTIEMLEYSDEVGYGHAPSEKKYFVGAFMALGHQLLGLAYDPNSQEPEI